MTGNRKLDRERLVVESTQDQRVRIRITLFTLSATTATAVTFSPPSHPCSDTSPIAATPYANRMSAIADRLTLQDNCCSNLLSCIDVEPGSLLEGFPK